MSVRRSLAVLVPVLLVIGLAAQPADARRTRRGTGPMQQGNERVAPGGCSGNKSADFDDNGSDDLAIGVPGEDLGGHPNAGGVEVIYGGEASTGLTADETGGARDDQFWTEASNGIADQPNDNDRFGRCAVAGNFNGDDFADLAIGIPGETIDGHYRAGAIEILYGSESGLRAAESQRFGEGAFGGSPASYEDFGSAVAAGDFNGDGFDDVAVGAPLENVNGKVNAGALGIMYGSSSGLDETETRFVSQDTEGTADSAEEDDKFGATIASGDSNGDGFADLAVGVPEEDLGDGNEIVDAGAFHVFYGGEGGLTPTDDAVFTQDTTGVLDQSEVADNFGWSLAFGDLDGDGYDDLGVSAPFEDLNGHEDAGVVHVLLGSKDGLVVTSDKLWTEEETTGEESATDWFGAAVLIANFGKGDMEDLAIGVPGKNVNGVTDAGAVEIIYSTTTAGLKDVSVFNQATDGIQDNPEETDAFGLSVAAGSYNENAVDDLAIGIPSETLHGDRERFGQGDGAVEVIYSSPSGLSPTGSPPAQFFNQDSPSVKDEAERNDLFGRTLG